MTEVQLGPTAQQVLTYMRSHPDEHVDVDELSEHLDSSPQQIRAALETLAHHELIVKARTSGGHEEYMMRR